jgi:osmoprotectant transport system permease protein
VNDLGLVLGQAPFPDTAWLSNPRTWERVAEMGVEHVRFTVLAVLLGFLVAAPLAVLAVRRRRWYTPLLAVTGILYTVPSLAMFLLLGALYGSLLAFRTALTGLVVYSLLILFRNTVAGLDSVPTDVREAAQAMGHTRLQQLRRVEIPVALPVVIAGLRVATVTTVGLVTITALVGWGGFGRLFIQGFNRQNATILLAGIVLCVTLATVLDLLLVALERRLLPWARKAG